MDQVGVLIVNDSNVLLTTDSPLSIPLRPLKTSVNEEVYQLLQELPSILSDTLIIALLDGKYRSQVVNNTTVLIFNVSVSVESVGKLKWMDSSTVLVNLLLAPRMLSDTPKFRKIEGKKDEKDGETLPLPPSQDLGMTRQPSFAEFDQVAVVFSRRNGRELLLKQYLRQLNPLTAKRANPNDDPQSVAIALICSVCDTFEPQVLNNFFSIGEAFGIVHHQLSFGFDLFCIDIDQFPKQLNSMMDILPERKPNLLLVWKNEMLNRKESSELMLRVAFELKFPVAEWLDFHLAHMSPLEMLRARLNSELLSEQQQIEMERKELLDENVQNLVYNPNPCFILVKPQDPEYANAVRFCGADLPKIVRKVNIPARSLELNNFKGIKGGKIVDSMHGTPAVSNGTSIALNGFDERRIGTHGTARGRGVYSAADFNYPRQAPYCGPVGCILVMKCCIVPGDSDDGHIYVTREVTRSVPVYILDYGDPDHTAEPYQDNPEVIELLKVRNKRLMEGLESYCAVLLEISENAAISLIETEFYEGLYRRFSYHRCIRKLPLYGQREQVISFLRANFVCLVEAGPGVGKSTQIPQIAADELLRKTARVLVLVPTRDIARGLASFVARERGCLLGDEVVFQVSEGDAMTRNTRIVYSTFDYFLQMYFKQNNVGYISKFSCVILDEIHLRSISCDMALSLVRLCRNQYPDIRIILMSATPETQAFVGYFRLQPEQILQIRALEYPVKVSYQADELNRDEIQKCVSASVNIVQDFSARGNILVFFSGVDEVLCAVERLKVALKANLERWLILPMYDSLSDREKDLAIHWDITSKQRLLVCSTGICENGLTIPNVQHVIDNGWEKRLIFDHDRNHYVDKLVRISKASAIQRCGRAGRTCPGSCLRLYSEVDYQSFPDFTPARVLELPLECVGLDVLKAGYNLDSFEWIATPGRPAMLKTYERLQKFGATGFNNVLTVGVI